MFFCFLQKAPPLVHLEACQAVPATALTVAPLVLPLVIPNVGPLQARLVTAANLKKKTNKQKKPLSESVESCD